MSFDPNKPSKEEGNFGQALDDTRSNLNDLNSRVSVQENLSLANVKNEVVAARGARATVGDRISQFLAPDGNPNFGSLRSMLWAASNDAPTYVDGLSFTVNGDRTATYLSGLLLRFAIGSSYAYADVASASYAAGTDKTTVTMRRSVLTAALSAVAIGVASLNREDISIPAINKVLASSANIVDVCVYDTRRDSDGGAWRKHCAHTSWENDALGTATRGMTREFPAIALIVAETTKLTIFDATDPDLAMWMIFNVGVTSMVYNNGGATSVRLDMRDGVLVVACKGGANGGLSLIDFPRDQARYYVSTELRIYNQPISDRNGVLTFAQVGTVGIINNDCNDAAITALTGAPVDPVTRLPVPTIVCATAGGVSVIHPDGRVTDSAAIDCKRVGVDAFGIWYSNAGNSNIYRNPWPATDVDGFTWTSAGSTFYGPGSTPAILGSVEPGKQIICKDIPAFGGLAGLSVLSEDRHQPTNGMVHYVTKDYTTGWLPGDIRFAGLANSKTLDRSAKGNDLTEVGVLAEAVVVTDAELKSYSGFSTANYLTMPYNSDYDFGTDNFYIGFWILVTPTGGVTMFVYSRSDGVWTGAAISIDIGAAENKLRFFVSDDGFATQDFLTSSQPIDDGIWHNCWCIRRGDQLEFWIDGRLDVTTPIVEAVGSLSNASATTTIGIRPDLATSPLVNGSLSIMRIGKGAPSAAQIRKIYKDERPLFVAGAKCLLGGTSNAITSISHDPVTAQSYVTTGDGVSVFKGLKRIGYIDAISNTNLTTDVMKTCAVVGGIAVIGSAAEALATLPKRNIRSDLMQGIVQMSKPVIGFDGVTSDATPTVIWSLPVSEGEELDITISVRAREAVDSPTERASYSKRATVYRDVGGDITLVGIDDLASDRESTGTMDCVIDVDTGSQRLRVKVTGVAATSIAWTGSAKLTGGAERWAA